MAHSDPVLLERILFNFVGNAIRYCARGGVLIGCRRRAGVLSLEVWDTGPGISGADLGHVFEEFHQLTPEGTHRARGAIGLGLSIAQRTAALLGHAIQVTSWLGRGSRFAVEVPEGTRPPCLAASLSQPHPRRKKLPHSPPQLCQKRRNQRLRPIERRLPANCLMDPARVPTVALHLPPSKGTRCSEARSPNPWRS